MTDYKCLIAKLAGGGLPSQVVVSVTVPVTTTSSWYLLGTYQQARRRQIARWQSPWVEHIQVQVASGMPAAVGSRATRLSRASEPRVAPGAWVQVRSCARPVPVAARRLGQSLRARRAAYSMTCIRWLRSPGLRRRSRSPNAGKVTQPRPAPARVRPGPPEAGASSWRHGKLNFAVSRPGTGQHGPRRGGAPG